MITSLSQDIANINRRSTLQDYQLIHTKLHDFIDKVNQKIVSRIQLVKQVYLDDYKQQVSQMSGQLRAIRGVLDQQLLKQRSNERLFYLEEQRDFFRAQVIKLNQQLRKAGEDSNKLKADLSQTKQQCENLRKIVYDLQTRIYKLTYENIQIEKLKEQSKNNPVASTINSIITPTKAQISSRDFKNRNTSDKISQNAETMRDNQNQNQPQVKLSRNKTQYSLRKLKPSYSLGATTANLQSNNNNPKQISTREQILDRCIKQLKKQIYYRNLGAKQANKINFQQEQKVSFQKFTKTDKKQLVYKFMSNAQILQQFYKFIFMKQTKDSNNNKQANELGSLDKIALAKGVDSRYNTKMLQGFKAQFDKRIYDIKANRY